MDPFICQRCGNCCIHYNIAIGYADIIKWKEQGRRDILKAITFVDNFPVKGEGGFYIMETLRKPKRECPFLDLKGYSCKIYDTRPMICRDFPVGHDGTFQNCKGNQKIISRTQHKKARQRQYADFLKAWNNRFDLIVILSRARKDAD